MLPYLFASDDSNERHRVFNQDPKILASPEAFLANCMSARYTLHALTDEISSEEC